MRLPCLSFALGLCALLGWAASAANAAADACLPQYVVPYSEQCDFSYHSIKKDPSVRNVAQAYDTCARAQAVAIVCLKAPNKQTHAIALSALYRDVGEQAEIALYTQHFPLAEALLREKRDVLRVMQTERPAADPALLRERLSIANDLQDAKAGECTTAALMNANNQGALAHDHKYAELAQLLLVKSQAYTACSPLATSHDRHAYIRYESLVALEESGRAAQAANDSNAANARYTTCLNDTTTVARDASPTVRRYLTIVHYLCKGRMNGKYSIDKPEPLDRDAARGFQPLAVPF